MWSKPAPPSASGNAMPVSPSSAAFLKSSRGKCPVSSSSFASGLTSDSANSRTLFCSSFCSSVSSRSKDVFSARKPARHLDSAFYATVTVCGSEEGLAEPVVSCSQIFRMDAGLTSHRHEVRVANPTRQCMQMQVSCHSGSRSAPKIHAQVHTIRFVICLKRFLHALRQLHHFFQRLWLAQIQVSYVGIRHDHHVSRRVRVSVQDNERLRAAMDNQSLGVLVLRQRVAENTFRLITAVDLRHVLVAPGSPDIIHCVGCLASKTCAKNNAK